MVVHYTDEELKDIISSTEFKESFTTLKNDNVDIIRDLDQFLNGLHANPQYFRLGITKKKYKKPQCEDTRVIKEINQLLNKITDITFESIYIAFSKIVSTKKYLLPFCIEKILIKCITQVNYMVLYVRVVDRLFQESFITKDLISQKLDICKESIHSDQPTTDKSEYDQLCDRNKKIDNQKAYSILVSYLEKYGLIDSRISTIIDDLLQSIDSNQNNDERYEFISCIYVILQTKRDTIDHSMLQSSISDIINKETSSKNKFKLMDIKDLLSKIY